jgi:hypothetical protein
VELYLDDDAMPQTALYDLQGVPRRGEQVEVFKFDRHRNAPDREVDS